jgi:hypothetical protein
MYAERYSLAVLIFPVNATCPKQFGVTIRIFRNEFVVGEQQTSIGILYGRS